MEMLIFFFVCLFAGVLAAYLVEQNHRKQPDRYRFGNKHDGVSKVDRLQRISRQLKSA